VSGVTAFFRALLWVMKAGFITLDESWFHHSDPEMKQQSME